MSNDLVALQAQLTEALMSGNACGQFLGTDRAIILDALLPVISAAIREAEARGRERGLVRAFDLIGDERMTTVTEMKRQRKRGLDDSWYRQRLAVINKIQGDVRSVARGVRVESPAEETEQDRHWMLEEFERARERNAQLPPHAKPVVTRPLVNGRSSLPLYPHRRGKHDV